MQNFLVLHIIEYYATREPFFIIPVPTSSCCLLFVIIILQFGFAHAVAKSHLQPLATKGILPELIAMTLAGGIAGGFQGFVLSPILLLKTRVMTDPMFRGIKRGGGGDVEGECEDEIEVLLGGGGGEVEENEIMSMSLMRTTLLSFTIGFDVVKNEGMSTLMKGSHIFALKRVFDWSTRYYFSDLFESMMMIIMNKKSDGVDNNGISILLLSPKEKIIASFLGGTVSTIVTLPLDVIVAKSQDAKKAGMKVSAWETFMKDYYKKNDDGNGGQGGWRGLYHANMMGFEARLVHVCLTTVVVKTGSGMMYDFLFGMK